MGARERVPSKIVADLLKHSGLGTMDSVVLQFTDGSAYFQTLCFKTAASANSIEPRYPKNAMLGATRAQCEHPSRQARIKPFVALCDMAHYIVDEVRRIPIFSELTTKTMKVPQLRFLILALAVSIQASASPLIRPMCRFCLALILALASVSF